MQQPALEPPSGEPWLKRLDRRPALPSWLLSVLLHVVVLLVLGMTLRMAPRQGASGERTADVGIVLKQQDADGESYQGDPAASEAAASTPSAAAGTSSLQEMLNDTPPVDPSDVLPKARGVIGAGALENGGVAGAGQATEGPRARTGTGKGGARLRVFGVEGEGHKFVYVFDRSGSMGGSGRNALAAAKAEMIASLKSLDTNHQFQIIFYNEQPSVFNPSGRRGKLAFGNEQNKTLARKFIGSITADGATRHESALKRAISMQPDVIFFLTDADEPRLSARQLAQINRISGGISINTIEFGFGPQSDADNFLVRLARQNGGRHAYVDISRLRPLRRNDSR